MTTATVVRLLDAASDAAWEQRGRDRAINAAEAVLSEALPEESTAAFAVWCRAVDLDDPSKLRAVLQDRYPLRDGVAISLKRAAFMAEQDLYQNPTP